MIELNTSIEQVTVYPDRARVLRRGATQLDPGLHTLIIPELPMALDPDSVRAAGRGSAGARLLGLGIEQVYYRESPVARVQELEAEIQALEDEETSQQNQQAIIQAQLTHLKGLASQTETFAKGLAFGRTQISDLAALLDYTRQQETELMADLQKIEISRRDLSKTLEKLRQELKQLRGARPRKRFVAKIELEVTQPGRFEADLIYTLKNASWRPLYDLRLWEATAQGEKNRLETTYLGQVQQNTGEDWSEVELILSTARPVASGALPDLNPWYLDVYAPRPAALHHKSRSKKAAMQMDNMMVGAVPDAEPAVELMEELVVVVATVETSGTAVTFHIGGRATIPSDGEPHKTTIANYELEPELDYVATPKLADAVYRRAQVTNTSEAVLLPGPANVFSGDEFIGRTELEHIAPSQTFELALGIDDRIKVERELVAHEVDKSLIGDKRRLYYGYQIEVENLRPTVETIIVRDHYPLPRHEQIKVKLESATPEPTEATEMHLLEWTLELATGQKETIRFDVQIEHPRSLTVTGLPD